MSAPVAPTNPQVMTPENVSLFKGLTVVRASTVVNKGICLGLYGAGGVGKTTMAALISKSKYSRRTLHCDVEGGASAIAHLDVGTVPITRWSDTASIIAPFNALKREVERGSEVELPYDTVIWDNCSELQNLSMRSIVPVAGQEQIQHFRQDTAQMLTFFRDWRVLSQMLGINVIFILWEELEKEEAVSAWARRVFLTPKLSKQFPGIITWIGHVKPNERDPGSRLVSFTPSAKTDSKARVAPNEAAAAIPTELVVKRDDPFLADMLDTIRGNVPWPVSKYATPRQAAQQATQG